MDFLALIISIFVIFFICTICGWCCRRKREGAIFSSPVVITQQTYQPNVGPYPVSIQGSIGGVQHPQPMHPGAYPIAQPIPGAFSSMPHPAATGYPMPQPAQTPSYPPYPVGGSNIGTLPYPAAIQPGPVQNPPSYDQAVTGEAYQKQSPYNPNYGGH